MQPKDEVVLVTGAGGSIGSAVCETLAERWGCRIVALDCDDTALHELAIRMEAVPGSRVEYVLHDVADDFQSVMKPHRRITTVIHAAAIKHVGIAERSRRRTEVVNVGGTAEACVFAEERGARMLLISTDKAASARCHMGRMKRQAEMHVLEPLDARLWSGVFRLGNVWWSRGSVLPTWEMRRSLGLPIPCVRGEVTRFGLTPLHAAECIVSCLYPPKEIPSCSIIVPIAMSRWKLSDLARAYKRAHPQIMFSWRDMPSHENAHEILFRHGEAARVYANGGERYAGPRCSEHSTDDPFLSRDDMEIIVRCPPCGNPQ